MPAIQRKKWEVGRMVRGKDNKDGRREDGKREGEGKGEGMV
jgi:hypothetical protein